MPRAQAVGRELSSTSSSAAQLRSHGGATHSIWQDSDDDAQSVDSDGGHDGGRLVQQVRDIRRAFAAAVANADLKHVRECAESCRSRRIDCVGRVCVVTCRGWWCVPAGTRGA